VKRGTVAQVPPVVVDNPSERRFEVHLKGVVVGRAHYLTAGDSVIVSHTEVDEGHEGQGLGSLLVRETLERIRASGKSVIPTCSFTAAYIRRHPEFIDLVEESLRNQYMATPPQGTGLRNPGTERR
jgi:predicted GNAT family acetyltransferase